MKSSFLGVVLALGFLFASAMGQDARPTQNMFRLSDRNYSSASETSYLARVPSMFGDGFFQYSGPISGSRTLDRLMVIASDLDAPNPLIGGNLLSITEAGPVGVFDTSLANVQQLQTLLRGSQPFPPATLVGTLSENASFTSLNSISAIQAQLAGTGAAFDIIAVGAAPAGYSAGVEAIFITRNGGIGSIVFDANGSGAFLQSGDDTLDAGDDLDAFYFFDYAINFAVDSPYAATVRSGTTKIANGGTPLPQNRVFFDYGLYTNVGFVPGGSTVNRFVPGFERAMMDGLFSVEVRMPFTATTSNDIGLSGGSLIAGDGVKFGNLTSFFKVLLKSTETFAISSGLALTLPSAPDIRIGDPNAPLVNISNQAVHLGPFVGWMFAPNDRCFAQGFTQFDFAANGNRVSFNGDGNGLREAGYLTDSAYIYSDLGVGYWIAPHSSYERPTALMAELHYSTSVTDSDLVRSGAFQVGSRENSVDILNATVGLSTQFSKSTSFSAGYIAPLTRGAETPDGGAQVRMEYRP